MTGSPRDPSIVVNLLRAGGALARPELSTPLSGRTLPRQAGRRRPQARNTRLLRAGDQRRKSDAGSPKAARDLRRDAFPYAGGDHRRRDGHIVAGQAQVGCVSDFTDLRFCEPCGKRIPFRRGGFVAPRVR